MTLTLEPVLTSRGYLPIASLRSLLLDRSKSMVKSSGYHLNSHNAQSLRPIANRYMEMWGGDMRTITRLLGRITRGEAQHISVDHADRWCLVLGYTLSTVYPELFE